MERDGDAAKVGAGETAAPGAACKPLLQAVRDGGLSSGIKETSAWMFEEWDRSRKRDQAALATERQRQAPWKMLAILLALIEVVRGVEAVVRHFSLAG